MVEAEGHAADLRSGGESLPDKDSEGADADRRQRELEARAAGLKAVATWHATRSIQTAREA